MEIISRKEALDKGLTRYFTGEPCIHGHVSERQVRDRKCMACWRPKRSEAVRRWKKANPDRTRQINLSSYHKHKNKEERKASVRKYKQSHRQQRRDEFKRWREARPEYVRARLKKWRDTHRDAVRKHVNARRAREMGAEGVYTEEDVARMFSAQKGACWCGKPLRLGYNVDHKVPLSRGGSNWPDNLQLLCPKCNGSKGTKTMEEWQGLREVAS